MADTRFNVRLFLEGYELDLADNMDLATTYTIASVQDISLISSNYTKSINLPGTKNNNKLFNWLYRIDSTGDQDAYDPNQPNIGYNFNFKKKAKASIIQDNQVILNGYAKLQSATVNNGLVTYSIQITSELGSLNADLGDIKLEDLDLYVPQLTSGYTHTFGIDTIRASWDNAPCTSFFYPLADYGDFDTLNGVNFYRETLRPCLFAKQYLDLIFSAVGYTYSSGFINSDYFKRLIIPFSDGNLVRYGDQTTVTRDEASGSITQEIRQDIIVSSATFFDDVIVDTNGNYNASTKVYHCTTDDTYRFDLNVPFHQNYYASTYPGTPIQNTQMFLLSLEIWVYNNATDLANGVVGNRLQLGFGLNAGGIGGVVLTSTSGQSGTLVANQTISYNLSTDNYIKFVLLSVGIIPNNQWWNYNGGTSFISGFTENVIHGREGQLPQIKISKTSNLSEYQLTYADFAIKNVKCSDYLSSLLKLFNLYIVPDDDRPKHFNIYTRDEYFGQGSQVDWTDKIDTKQDTSVVPIPLLDAKQLYFSYKPDNDWFNQQYTALNGGVYGDLRLDTGYEFTKDTKNVLDKVIFSPTPIIQYDNAVYACETTCEVLNSNLNILWVTGFSDIDDNNGTYPDQGGFVKARVGAQIRFGNGFHTITSVLTKISSTDSTKRFNYRIDISPAITKTEPDYDGTFYQKYGTFTYLTNNDKAIPAIYQTSDNNITRKPFKANPRILYWAGNVPCNSYFLFSYLNVNNPFIDNPFSYGHSYQIYPYVSHLNSNSGATVDLLFDQPKVLNFNYNDAYPTFNLYNGYWINTTNEILDQEAKLLTGNFKLDAIDISNVELNDTIFIDNTEYRINQIKDFKADRSITTEVELIRKPFRNIIDNPIYTASTRAAFGSIQYKNIAITGLTIDNVLVNGSDVFIFNGEPIPYPTSNRFSRYNTGTWPISVDYTNNASGLRYIKCTDSNGTVINSTNPLNGGSGNFVFNNVVIDENNPVVFEVLAGVPATTTTTTLAPVNVNVFICGTQTMPGHAQGTVNSDVIVNTNVTVDFYVNLSSGAQHYVSVTILAGTDIINWSDNYSTLLTFVDITPISITPASSGNYFYNLDGFIGGCGGDKGFGISNMTVGGIFSNVTWNGTPIDGVTFPVSQGQQTSGTVPAELGVVVATITGSFGYMDVLDSASNFQELLYTGGSNTYTFYDVYGSGFDDIALSMWDFIGPTTTTTVAPTTTTTTTAAPANVTITVCWDDVGGSAEGLVLADIPVNTDVEVYLHIVDSLGNHYYQNPVLNTGQTSKTWAQFTFGASTTNVEIILVSPSSFGSYTYINGGSIGSCL